MRIFETILFEYVFGYMLQGFALILGIYAFCRQKVKLKQYLISSFILIIILFVMRYVTNLLSISFGLHTIADLLCALLIGVLYLKMPVFAALRSILIITILLIFTEGLFSVFLMTHTLGPDKVSSMMNDSLGKAIVALPSSIIFALLIVVSYFILLRIEKKKSVGNGERSSKDI